MQFFAEIKLEGQNAITFFAATRDRKEKRRTIKTILSQIVSTPKMLREQN